METVINNKEKVVIFFFWLMLGIIVVMSIINFSRVKFSKENTKNNKEDKEHKHTSSIEEKIMKLNNILKDNPKDLNALITLGEIYYDNKIVDKAIEIFEKVIIFQPENSHIHNDLGLLYQQTGQIDLAIQSFKNVLKNNPKHINTLLHLGIIYRYTKKDNKKALKIFKKVLSLNPQSRISDMINKEIEKIIEKN